MSDETITNRRPPEDSTDGLGAPAEPESQASTDEQGESGPELESPESEQPKPSGRALSEPDPPRPDSFAIETVKATLEACVHDLDQETDRLRSIDAKLSQLASFAGISISISGSVGGSVLATGRLPLGFLITLGTCIALAAALLLAAVITSFRALAPKLYIGPEEEAIKGRTTPDALSRPPEIAIATFAASRRDVLIQARKINDAKAAATTKTFVFAGAGFFFIVIGVIVTAIGSVV